MKVSAVRSKLAKVCGTPSSVAHCKGFTLLQAPKPFTLSLNNGKTVTSKLSGNGCAYEVRVRAYLSDGFVVGVEGA